MNIICILRGHKWNGCTCTRCGEVRDEQHRPDKCGETCQICGRVVQHRWNVVHEETVGPNEYGCVENVTTTIFKCAKCGKLRKEVRSDFHETEWDAEITDEDRKKI